MYLIHDRPLLNSPLALFQPWTLGHWRFAVGVELVWGSGSLCHVGVVDDLVGWGFLGLPVDTMLLIPNAYDASDALRFAYRGEIFVEKYLVKNFSRSFSYDRYRCFLWGRCDDDCDAFTIAMTSLLYQSPCKEVTCYMTTSLCKIKDSKILQVFYWNLAWLGSASKHARINKIYKID